MKGEGKTSLSLFLASITLAVLLQMRTFFLLQNTLKLFARNKQNLEEGDVLMTVYYYSKKNFLMLFLIPQTFHY